MSNKIDKMQQQGALVPDEAGGGGEGGFFGKEHGSLRAGLSKRPLQRCTTGANKCGVVRKCLEHL